MKKKSGDRGKSRDDDSGDNGKGNEVVFMTDTSAAAARKRAKEQLSKGMAGMVMQVGS